MSKNVYTQTRRIVHGMSEVPKDALKMKSFDALFTDVPETEFLKPIQYTEQSIAREIFKPGFRRHYVGYFASRINYTLIPFESILEKHACTVFESYAEIQSYRSQPYGMRIIINGKAVTVYPDFELTMNQGLALVDIKYYENTLSPKFKARYWALKDLAEKQGMSYTLLTEEELHSTRKTNAGYLLSLCRGEPHKILEDEVRLWLVDSLPIDFQQILLLTRAYPAARAVIAGLILDGVLPIDWDVPVETQTVHHPDERRISSWLG